MHTQRLSLSVVLGTAPPDAWQVKTKTSHLNQISLGQGWAAGKHTKTLLYVRLDEMRDV